MPASSNIMTASCAVSLTARKRSSLFCREAWVRSRVITAPITSASVPSVSISTDVQCRTALQSSIPIWPHHSPATEIGTNRFERFFISRMIWPTAPVAVSP